MSSSLAGQLILIAALSVIALAAGGALFHRMQAQNQRLTDAIENMSQGLCMFDKRARIILVNRRYLDMYQLDPKVVHAGMTLTELIRARKDTGLFQGDVGAYVAKIMEGIRAGSSAGHVVPAGGGRLVLAKNEVMPGGGWVSTHEDVTEQRKAEEERAASRDQERRRSMIDEAIKAFRPKVESLLSSVSENAVTLAETATSLFSASSQTTERAESAVSAFHEASTNVETAAVAADELARSIAEISRQLGHATEIVASRDRRGTRNRRTDRRPCHRRAEDRRRHQDDPQHCRTNQPAGAQRHHRGGARRRGRQAASRWLPPR